MWKACLWLLKMLAAGTPLTLGCLAIVYSAEIVAFFRNHAMWIIAGLAVITALVVVSLALGSLLRRRGLQPPGRRPAAAGPGV